MKTIEPWDEERYGPEPASGSPADFEVWRSEMFRSARENFEASERNLKAAKLNFQIQCAVFLLMLSWCIYLLWNTL